MSLVMFLGKGEEMNNLAQKAKLSHTVAAGTIIFFGIEDEEVVEVARQLDFEEPDRYREIQVYSRYEEGVLISSTMQFVRDMRDEPGTEGFKKYFDGLGHKLQKRFGKDQVRWSISSPVWELDVSRNIH